MSGNDKKTILAVDDEVMAAEMIEDSLDPYYNVLLASSAVEAKSILQTSSVDLILCDQRMPKQTGIEFLTYVREYHPQVVRVLLTGYSSLDDAIVALNNHCLDRYLSKPWDEEELLRLIDEELRQKELGLQNDRLKNQLMQSAYHHQILIDTMAESYVSINVAGQILQTNNKMCEILERSQREVVDSNVLAYLRDPKLRKSIEDVLHVNREQGESVVVYHDACVELMSRGGQLIPMELTISSLYFRENLEFICLFHDIREAVEREDLLEKAKAQAEAASEAKSIFLAEMSHELRTPLHSILSYAEVCEMDLANLSQEKIVDAFKVVRENGHLLLNMINNVLDLAKMESGAMDYTFVVCDLVTLMKKVIREMSGLFEGKSIDVELNVIENEFYAEADSFRIQQVLRNILGNSVKFSPIGGKITLSLTLISNRVQILIEDEGPGIPADEINVVFDHFQQSQNNDSSGGGTGLGLSICHEIVHEHHGEIELRNRADKGLLCKINFPLVQGA